MNVAAIPFNRFLGLESDGSSLRLPANPHYLNHIGTVHATAQFALAEAASGQWLLDNFGAIAADHLVVVRHVQLNYRRPANGELAAAVEVAPDTAARFGDTLENRGRAAIEVPVRVTAANGEVTLEATFEWFAKRNQGSTI